MNKKILIVGESHHGKHLEEIKKILGDLNNIDQIFIELPI